MNKKKHAMPPDATRDAEQLITRLATEPCACGTGIDHMVQECHHGSVWFIAAALSARDAELARLKQELNDRCHYDVEAVANAHLKGLTHPDEIGKIERDVLRQKISGLVDTLAVRDAEIARLTMEFDLALHARDAYVEDLTDLRATLVARDVESAQLRKNLQVMAFLQSPARMDAALEARDIELADLTAVLHQVEKVLQHVIGYFGGRSLDREGIWNAQALLKEGRTVLALVQAAMKETT